MNNGLRFIVIVDESRQNNTVKAKEYKTGGNKSENKTRLQTAGFVFNDNIIRDIYSGETTALSDFDIHNMNTDKLCETLNTRKHTHMYRQKIGVKGKIWINETKGGFDKSNNSEDIDIFSPKKFEALKDYGLQGGFVRYDKKSEELCVCRNTYTDDVNSDSWMVLGSVLG